VNFLLNDKRYPEEGYIPFLEVLHLISDEIDTSNIDTFIECGSGPLGDNAVYFSNFFNVITIELNKTFHERYCNREGVNHNIEWVLGDGREGLRKVLTERPDERFVILLDDHDGYTSFISEEMEMIRDLSNRNDHIIIVDDMKFAGRGSYPAVEVLEILAKKINPNYNIKNTEIGNDIFVIYPNKESK